MSRYEDCLELLSTTEEFISKLEQEYSEAKSSDEILNVHRVSVKSCLENIRSVFEYIAMDVYESYSRKNSRIYFPYGEDEPSFNRSLNRNIPGLAIQAPELLTLVESVQPHRCGDNWLVEFCKATNFNKHNRLSRQIRKNSRKSTVKIPGFMHLEGVDSVVMENITINGHPLVNGRLVIDKDSRFKDMRSQINENFSISRTFEWVEFNLEDVEYDIHKLLNRAHLEAKRLAIDVREVISTKA
ncbi:hypothetical protein [Pseudomonas sp.]|uniref:hypothetical protein n=1 Tax=Pseudomonas sp. TaxID=306 RepID=UPI003D6E02D6